MRPRPLPLRALPLLAVLAGWPGQFGTRATGQDSESRQWVQQIPYDPPNASHTKAELSGRETTLIPGPERNILIKEVKIKQFSLTNSDPEMVAEAPEGVFDYKHRVLSSAGSLRVHAQGEKFTVTGTGFLYDNNKSTLVISNQVHSLLQLQSGTNALSLPPTEISSHSARYDGSNSLAVYWGSVRVVDPKMNVSAEFLTAESPKGVADPSNHVTITVKTNVVIDSVSDSGDPIHATSDQAVYTSDSRDGAIAKLLELTGNPRIELTNGWMTADRFVFDQTSNNLRGSGNFHFHYLAQAGGTNQTSASAGTELFSSQFEMDTTTQIARFWGGVWAESPEMQLKSEALTATLPKPEAGKTNRLDHLLAETNVVIDLADLRAQKIHATGQKAAYDYKIQGATTNEVLELTGNPTVEVTTTNRAAWMTADIITVDRAQGRIWGAGNHHSVFKKQTGDPATLDTEVYSENFDYADETGLAVYHDHVRAYDPGMNATAANSLTIKLAKSEPGKTNKIDNFRADGGVMIDFLKQAFYPGDITNLTAFAARLKQPADPVAQFVGTNLTDATRLLLANDSGGTNSELQLALVAELNRLTQRGAVYEPARFAKVVLSPDTTDLLHQHPLGAGLVELNRLLLLDAFRGDLKRNQKGEITRATGEQASYDYKDPGASNHEVLELSGHPRVEQPDRWTTAEEAIIYDLTTQKYRFVGKNHSRLKLEAVKSLPGKTKK